MKNFTYHNPVKIVFGKQTITELKKLIPEDARVMVVYGGGSIKKNGVYDQVQAALDGFNRIEFGGIEPNPRYETCIKAIEIGRDEQVDFLLAVGGGSVIDGVKFIAAGIQYSQGDPWDILSNHAPVISAVPFGVVLTLPATGSEMNGGSVISRKSTKEKLVFGGPHTYPQFAVLDPETTYSLPERQLSNGIVDTFVHVLEQYLTYDVNTPLQDRQAEAILKTVIEEAPKVFSNPTDYDVRANLMWCATNALNNTIGLGVVSDWATHMIGHELTALYGLDHGQTLSIVMPSLLKHQKERKRGKLLQYAERVWGMDIEDPDRAIDEVINKTREFFKSAGSPVTLSEMDVPVEAAKIVADRLQARKMKLGEHRAIGHVEVVEILTLAR